MTTDGDISRAINALQTTFNDQRVLELDVARAEKIVTGALAGERKLKIHPEAAPHRGWLGDEEGNRVAEIVREDGRWEVRRTLPARD